MRKAFLITLSVSALLFGEQKLDLELPSDSLSTPQDSIIIESPEKKPRIYNYRYQIVSGVAMMLFFGIMLGASESLNPK